MRRILLVGGTGTVGKHVARQLAGAPVKVRALLRHPEAARLPPGIEAVRGDLTEPESLELPLQNVDAIFLVWTAPPDFVVPVLERMARTAKRVVFLSAPLKTDHPFFQQPNPARNLAEKIERVVSESGLEWTFLRPGIFAANALNWWAPQIRAGGVVRWPYLSVATAPVDERDIADVAVRALCQEGHAGAEYVLTGPESLTQLEQLSAIADVTGRRFRIEDLPPEEARREWLRTWPPSVANMLLDAWRASVGQPAFVSPVFEEITGSPPRRFVDWAADHARLFESERPAGSVRT